MNWPSVPEDYGIGEGESPIAILIVGAAGSIESWKWAG